MKSLLATQHPLGIPSGQVQLLEDPNGPIPTFDAVLAHHGSGTLRSESFETLQVNIGKMCNQKCVHCHVDAGPDRKERMSRGVMEDCLRTLDAHDIRTVDITGGAPEMHPDFRWFLEQCATRDVHLIVRCNLTIIVSNKAFHDLPVFYKRHKVEVVCSLPFYTSDRTDRQRGKGVFEDSVRALRMLNEVGYGYGRDDLQLNMVHNPAGYFLPGPQDELEKQFKRSLLADHGIRFDKLYAITNLPISRFLDRLMTSGHYDDYMEKLLNAFNPAAVDGVMCRSMISVGHDGKLYDCDFNQMLDLPLSVGMPRHIRDLCTTRVSGRCIVTGRHCFGCTAGAGSSCSGSTT